MFSLRVKILIERSKEIYKHVQSCKATRKIWLCGSKNSLKLKLNVIYKIKNAKCQNCKCYVKSLNAKSKTTKANIKTANVL